MTTLRTAPTTTGTAGSTTLMAGTSSRTTRAARLPRPRHAGRGHVGAQRQQRRRHNRRELGRLDHGRSGQGTPTAASRTRHRGVRDQLRLPKGADVVNGSFGAPVFHQAIADAIKRQPAGKHTLRLRRRERRRRPRADRTSTTTPTRASCTVRSRRAASSRRTSSASPRPTRRRHREPLEPRRDRRPPGRARSRDLEQPPGFTTLPGWPDGFEGSVATRGKAGSSRREARNRVGVSNRGLHSALADSPTGDYAHQLGHVHPLLTTFSTLAGAAVASSTTCGWPPRVASTSPGRAGLQPFADAGRRVLGINKRRLRPDVDRLLRLRQPPVRCSSASGSRATADDDATGSTWTTSRRSA